MKTSIVALAIFFGIALAAPTATAFPKPASSTGLPAAKVIPAGTTFDGKMVRYSRSPDTCQDQTETDEAAAMFIAEDGATIKNVILSKAQAEGIHCRGACTLENVWWEDVCEDAATFKQPAGKTSYVIGGGAKGLSTTKVIENLANTSQALQTRYSSSMVGAPSALRTFTPRIMVK